MLDNWDEKFPNCEPVAHWLRMVFHSRWVRFHCLSESKRYPENQEEYATVLNRQNRVLGELTEPESKIILLSTGYTETPEPALYYPELRALNPNAKLWRTIPMHELDEKFPPTSYWHVWASEWIWRPGIFDPILRLVADDVAENVMMVDPGCRWFHHPYDGGMDVILGSPDARNRLAA